MCLGIPMEVVEPHGFAARCQARGTERTVGLLLLGGEPVEAGDWVLVHLGHAQRKLTASEAEEAWEILDTMGMAEPLAP